MPSPNATFTDIVTTTLRHHPAEIADNVTENNALLRELKKMDDGIQLISGGYSIVEPLEYDTLNYQRYSGYQVLDISAKEIFTAAEFPWQQAAVMVTSSGLETRIQNAGPEQITSLIRGRISNAKKSAANNQAIDIYSNGALANQIGGLGLLLQTNGQGTVGGINSLTYPFWQNTFRDFSGTPGPTTIKDEMNQVWYSLVRGADKPNLIVSTIDWFAFYESSQQELQRYASSDTADAGFPTLKYHGIKVMFDSNVNFASNGQKMFFLNTNYIHFKTHRGTNWVTHPTRQSVNQDAEVVPLFWAGNMTVSNRSLQGLLFN